MPFAIAKSRFDAAARSREEFQALANKTYKQAFALAYRLTGNRPEAEDLVQESYLRAFRFFHRYDSSLPFTSWFYRIMSNAHVDSVRRRGRLRTTSLEFQGPEGVSAWEVADTQPTVEREMLDRTLAEPVQRGLDAMNSEFRLAVLLADVEGLSYEEVAEIMNTSVGTVRSRIHRGRKQLRTYLLRHAPEAYGQVSHEL